MGSVGARWADTGLTSQPLLTSARHRRSSAPHFPTPAAPTPSVRLRLLPKDPLPSLLGSLPYPQAALLPLRGEETHELPTATQPSRARPRPLPVAVRLPALRSPYPRACDAPAEATSRRALRWRASSAAATSLPGSSTGSSSPRAAAPQYASSSSSSAPSCRCVCGRVFCPVQSTGNGGLGLERVSCGCC